METVRCRNREAKLLVVGDRLQECLRGNVLDVGCDQKTLQRFVDGRYVGIDLAGAPDLRCDVEHPLPFRDGCFDCVTAFDVLEHVDAIHFALGELCRVSRQFVVLGLPNMYEWRFRWAFLRGNRLGGKYGLPLTRPADRHKWFFSLTDARQFARAQSQCYGFAVYREIIGFYDYRRSLPRLLSAVGERIAPRGVNLLAAHYWAILSRRAFSRDNGLSLAAEGTMDRTPRNWDRPV
jgi:SAM-dependent methyltransferase